MAADWTFPDDGVDYDLGLNEEQLKTIITVFKGRRTDITDVLVTVLNTVWPPEAPENEWKP